MVENLETTMSFVNGKTTCSSIYSGLDTVRSFLDLSRVTAPIVVFTGGVQVESSPYAGTATANFVSVESSKIRDILTPGNSQPYMLNLEDLELLKTIPPFWSWIQAAPEVSGMATGVMVEHVGISAVMMIILERSERPSWYTV